MNMQCEQQLNFGRFESRPPPPLRRLHQSPGGSGAVALFSTGGQSRRTVLRREICIVQEEIFSAPLGAVNVL